MRVEAANTEMITRREPWVVCWLLSELNDAVDGHWDAEPSWADKALIILRRWRIRQHHRMITVTPTPATGAPNAASRGDATT